jgi:hypothetical protein
MGNASRYFTYPLTCCNISNVFTANWNNFNSQQLQSASYCAINGTNIYQDVSLFICGRLKLCLFRVVLINL